MPALQIIDRETFELCQMRSGARSKLATSQRGRGPRSLLSGLMTCGECGGRMTIIGAGKRWNCRGYFRCYESLHGACDNRTTVAVEVAEHHIVKPELDAVQSDAFMQAATAELRAMIKANPQLSKPKSIVEALDKVERKLAQLAALVKEGTLDADTVEDSVAALYKQRDKLNAQAKGGKVVDAGLLFQHEKLVRAKAAVFRAQMTGDDVVLAREALRLDLGTIVCKPVAMADSGRGNRANGKVLVASFPESQGIEHALIGVAVGGEFVTDLRAANPNKSRAARSSLSRTQPLPNETSDP